MSKKTKSKKTISNHAVENYSGANLEAPYSHLASTVENNNFGTSLANEDTENNR